MRLHRSDIQLEDETTCAVVKNFVVRAENQIVLAASRWLGTRCEKDFKYL